MFVDKEGTNGRPLSWAIPTSSQATPSRASANVLGRRINFHRVLADLSFFDAPCPSALDSKGPAHRGSPRRLANGTELPFPSVSPQAAKDGPLTVIRARRCVVPIEANLGIGPERCVIWWPATDTGRLAGGLGSGNTQNGQSRRPKH